jgi:TonB family protein
MRDTGKALKKFENFGISAAAHALCLFLLLTLPMCRHAKKPEGKVYTFDLIDPSKLTMKKPKEAPKAENKKPDTPKRKKVRKKKAKKKQFALPKKSVEDKIQEQLDKIEKKEWLEPSKLNELEMAKRIDTGEFKNSWYNDAVASKIYRCWHTPSKITVETEECTVVVRFKIARDGSVSILGIDRKSGSEVLDRSALQAIRDAQPLPPLPQDYKGDSLEVCMTFVPEE